MWMLADITFLVGFLVVAFLAASLFESLHVWWFERSHPCACELNPDGRIDWLGESRVKCPRHNPVVFRRFDRLNVISILAVIAGALIALLELHRRCEVQELSAPPARY